MRSRAPSFDEHFDRNAGRRTAASEHLETERLATIALAPLPRIMGPSPSVDVQVEELRRAGVRVAVARPDAAARRVIGQAGSARRTRLR